MPDPSPNVPTVASGSVATEKKLDRRRIPRIGLVPPTKASDAGAALRRSVFVREYLANGNNATQAAIAAGFAERNAGTTGWKLLKRADVQALLQQERQRIESEAAITADFVLGRLKAESMTAESDAARVAALHLLAKHLGLFAPEQHNHQFVGTLFAQHGRDEGESED